MGCWNGSCALTGAPIYHKEEVYVTHLVEQELKVNDYCYPTKFFAPLGIWFNGQYDDYGRVDNCTNPLLPLLMDHIRRHLFELPKEDYRDAVTKDSLSFDNLFDVDHEGRLFFTATGWGQRENKEKVAVRHITIHKGILDNVLETYKMQAWLGNGVTKYTYADLLESGSYYVQKYATNPLTSPPEYPGLGDSAEDIERRWIMFKYSSVKPRARDVEGPTKLFTHLMEMAEDGAYRKGMHRIHMTELFTDSLQLGDKADIGVRQELVRQLALNFTIHSLMEDMRRMWVPPSGMGSQDTDLSAFTAVAKAMTKHIKFDKHRWDD